jgi:hypothetical protein
VVHDLTLEAYFIGDRREGDHDVPEVLIRQETAGRAEGRLITNSEPHQSCLGTLGRPGAAQSMAIFRSLGRP